MINHFFCFVFFFLSILIIDRFEILKSFKKNINYIKKIRLTILNLNEKKIKLLMIFSRLLFKNSIKQILIFSLILFLYLILTNFLENFELIVLSISGFFEFLLIFLLYFFLKRKNE